MTLWQKPHPWAKGGTRHGVVGPRLAGGFGQQVVGPPVILPHGGDCEAEQVVCIENDSKCPEAVIFYTVDGTQPTIQSAQYRGPFKIQIPQTPQVAVRAIAAIAVDRKSGPTTEIFRLNSGKSPPPEWSRTPQGTITLTHYPSATAYYTPTPNADPLQGGYLYTGPFLLRSETDAHVTLTAVAIVPGCAPSDRVPYEVDVEGDLGVFSRPPQDDAGQQGASHTHQHPTQTVHPETETRSTAITPKGSTDGTPRARRYPYPPVKLDIEHQRNPPAMTVRPRDDSTPSGDGSPLRVYYNKDGGEFVPLPESDQLVIPLTDEEHVYGFVQSSAGAHEWSPAVCSPVVYLYIPRRPRWESKADMKYIMDQALKWLWEVFNKLKAVHVQWRSFGYSDDAPTLLFCLDKMESAIVLILYHLSSCVLVYPGVNVEGSEKALGDIHFREANDSLMGLYHLLLDLNNIPSHEEILHRVQDALKDAVYRVKLIVSLLPDPPKSSIPKPPWLEKARECIGGVEWGVFDAVLQGGLDTAKICKEREREEPFPEHADAFHKLISELCKRLQESEDERHKLKAALQQAQTDADTLRNDIDEREAWQQAARIREAALEARIEELRRLAVPAPQATQPTPTAVDSHLAFLINPD